MAPSPREVVLFLHALRLARAAQAVDRIPLPELVHALPRLRGLPRGVGPDEALSATVRATGRGARWFGWRGTCLVKALVLSSLLADRDGVELVIGIRKGEGATAIDGHAWVRVGEKEFSLLGTADAAKERYVTMTTLPLSSSR